MIDVCQMLQETLEKTKNNFGTFNSLLAKKHFETAHEAIHQTQFLLKHLRELTKEYIPPPKLEKVEFKIFPPSLGREIPITYVGTNRLQCMAYNQAIPEIFKKAGMQVIMCSGHHEETGYKAFELIGPEPTKGSSTVEKLIPDIHKLASRKYQEYLKFGFHKV